MSKKLVKKKVLVVIDLQPGFLKRAKEEPRVLVAAEAEIKFAYRADWQVVFVEFAGHGETEEKLKRAAPNALFAEKNEDDGSHAVQTLLYREKIEPLSFDICGINTPWCIRSTALGLADRFPEVPVQVLIEATADYSSQPDQKFALSKIRDDNGTYQNLFVGSGNAVIAQALQEVM